MGHPPLAENNEISEIREWLIAKGIRKTKDIFDWDRVGNWQRWVFPRVPVHLNYQLDALKVAISDFATVHTDDKDTWGWGKTSVYTTSQGYLQMQRKKDSASSGTRLEVDLGQLQHS